ncbi:hypothetical protein ACFL54_06880 [Planctomycetota bacterium]
MVKWKISNKENATYPDDWNAFKKRLNLKLIAIPDDAVVSKLSLGKGMFGETIHIWFTLPDTKSPPQWLAQIAEESGCPDRKPAYMPQNIHLPKDKYDKLTLEEAKKKEWAMVFEGDPEIGGFLRYKQGTYDYVWSND